MREGDRGISIVEVLVTAVLILLVMGTVYALLVLSKHSWNVISARATVAINCEVAAERIRHEMQESTASSIALGTGVISFLSARDPTGLFVTNSSGKPVWQQNIVYYVDATHQVLRRNAQWAASSAPLTPTQMGALTGGKGTLVAYRITNLSASLNGSQVSLALTCQMLGVLGNDSLSASSLFSLQN